MKKIMALVLTLVIAISSITVFALTDEEIVIYYREHYSDELTYEEQEEFLWEGFTQFLKRDDSIIQAISPEGTVVYFPQIIDGNIYYMDNKAHLYMYKDEHSTFVSSAVHYDNCGEVTLKESLSGLLTYDRESFSISYYVMGNLEVYRKLPNGAIYAGYSKAEGAIFRTGSDVYAFNLDTGLQQIASGVKLVVETNYMWASDFGYLPLLYMEDGSLLVYCSTNNYDSSHLYPITRDGEFQY